MKGQTKKHSVIEIGSGLIIGYVLAVVSQVYIFPYYGINIPIQDNMAIAAWFTVISFIRSYFIRRWFNKWMVKLWHLDQKKD